MSPQPSAVTVSLAPLYTHMRCIVVLTAAACSNCNAFITTRSISHNVLLSSKTVRTCQYASHLLAFHCSPYPSPGPSCRRRRFYGPAVTTVAAYRGGISEELMEAVAGQDVADRGRMVAAKWQGNGPDPLGDSQLRASDFAVAAAAAGVAGSVEERTKPFDHPGLEVWMNGPFQAPVPMGPVDIIHVDDDIVVMNKPSGLLCVPGRIEKDSIATRVALELGHYRVDKMVVHRLDMATSGVVVMARSDAALKSLHQQFRERTIGKVYLAMVHGVLSAEEGEVDLPVCRNTACPPLHMVNAEMGKPALTQWRVVGRAADRTRVALVPVSGRSHQLRLHMDAISHPILGDHFYGNKESLALADRCLLHAETLTLSHPVTGERRTFTAPCDF